MVGNISVDWMGGVIASAAGVDMAPEGAKRSVLEDLELVDASPFFNVCDTDLVGVRLEGPHIPMPDTLYIDDVGLSISSCRRDVTLRDVRVSNLHARRTVTSLLTLSSGLGNLSAEDVAVEAGSTYDGAIVELIGSSQVPVEINGLEISDVDIIPTFSHGVVPGAVLQFRSHAPKYAVDPAPMYVLNNVVIRKARTLDGVLATTAEIGQRLPEFMDVAHIEMNRVTLGPDNEATRLELSGRALLTDVFDASGEGGVEWFSSTSDSSDWYPFPEPGGGLTCSGERCQEVE